jgi:hypothetical protein
MPSHDGFHRLSPTHCDHNRGLFDLCDECTVDNRRTFSLIAGRRYDLTYISVSIAHADGPAFVSTLTDLSPVEAYKLTTDLAAAGWVQFTPQVAS